MGQKQDARKQQDRKYLGKNLTIGELLDELKKSDPMNYIWYDFPNTYPAGLSAYFGLPNCIALGHADFSDLYHPDNLGCKVGELNSLLRINLENRFLGKSGEITTMSLESDIWVAGLGDISGIALVGVAFRHGAPVLLTAYREEGLGSAL